MVAGSRVQTGEANGANLEVRGAARRGKTRCCLHFPAFTGTIGDWEHLDAIVEEAGRTSAATLLSKQLKMKLWKINGHETLRVNTS